MKSEQSKLLHLETLGLDFNPFPVVPDAHNYFITERMHVAISDILHCIEARKGFILISGEVGLGKTTLSRLLLLKLAAEKVSTALILNTFLQSGSLLKAINKDFNIYIESNAIEDQLDALNSFLLSQYSQNRNCVIVIDDAQQLNLESLELVRQLSNLETNQNKLVQIILVAQGEILTTLNRNDMRQLKSRIALNIKIEPLTLTELKQYIKFRLARAGSNGQIILEPNAYKQLHKFTQGLPRQINLIMDRCLYVVAAYGKNRINKNLITKAYQEISIDNNTKITQSYKIKTTLLAALLLLVVGFPFYLFKDKFISHVNTGTLSSITTDINTENTTQIINLANVKQPFAMTPPIEQPHNNNKNTENNHRTLTENQYLQQFGLESLQSVFIESIKSDDFSQLKKQLQQSSDLKLLLGNKIVADKNTQAQVGKEIWEFQNAQNQTMWLTFWKPQITLSAFYQGYYSESISKLQHSLKNEGYYRAVVDGIVGEKTIFAVTKLQTSLGYNPSGFPDELTLYRLQKLNTTNLGNEESEHQIEYYPIKKKSKKENKLSVPVNRYAIDNSIITD